MAENPQHILVVHIAGLSQTVLAIPALRALRQHFPAARITMATSVAAAEIITLSRCVDEVLPLLRLRRGEVFRPFSALRSRKTLTEIKRGYYDLAIELNSSTETGLLMQIAHPQTVVGQHRNSIGHKLSVMLERATHTLLNQADAKLLHDAQRYLQKLEPLGVRPSETEPRLLTDPAADARFELLLQKHKIVPGELLIGIHPGASKVKPRWDYERFCLLAGRLHYHFKARLLIFAGSHERGLARQFARQLQSQLGRQHVIAVESAKLPDFVSACARLSLFIGNHSGPAHVAAAVGAPTVIISPHPQPTAQDVLSRNQIHVRAPHIALIEEEAVYQAACQMLQSNRASVLSAR